MREHKIIIVQQSVGTGEPVFVIAEAGVNHNGDLATAFRLVDVASSAGADAVKFQTFIADEVVAPAATKADYQKLATGSDESQLEMVKRLQLSFEDFRKIKAHCDSQGITFLSTPFDFKSVDFLNELGIPAFKVSSGDLTNHPLLQYVARKGRPVILSTGMSDLNEVADALAVVRSTGNNQIALLQCVTNYPAEAADVNLRAMRTMEESFNVLVGYSDHTLGTEVTLAAAALGASIIEKHFTLNKDLPGPDHRASLEPQELKAMVAGIRKVEAALGNGVKAPAPSEADNKKVARRSLVAARDIKAGTRMTPDAIAFKRPGTGLPPATLNVIVGRTALVDIGAGSMLALEMFD